jgi:hypothetical protein
MVGLGAHWRNYLLYQRTRWRNNSVALPKRPEPELPASEDAPFRQVPAHQGPYGLL